MQNRGFIGFILCPHVFVPVAINGGASKSSCSFIIPKFDTVTIGKSREAIEQAKQEGVPKWNGKILPNLKLPLRDVDCADDPAYENSYFINATSQEQPGVVDGKRVKIIDQLAIYYNVDMKYKYGKRRF